MELKDEIKKAKIEYSPVWRISSEVFTKAASEILDIDIKRLQVRRHIIAGDNWGKLSVFVFNNTEDQRYYALEKNEYVYDKLPTNINEFKNALIKLKQ